MDMKTRLDKLGTLMGKYPELSRANELSKNFITITNVFSADVEVVKAFNNLEIILNDNPQQKKIDESIKMLDVILSTFKTKAELIDWCVKQQDTFITRLVMVYIFLKDMK